MRRDRGETLERPREAPPRRTARAPSAGPSNGQVLPASRFIPSGPAYWLAVGVLGVLGMAGLVALGWLAFARPASPEAWGYAAATLSFLLSTAQAAPILAFATRATDGYWAVSLRRVAELFAVAGVVTAPLAILLIAQLPAWEGRESIWFDWPGAPIVWDSVAVVGLALLGFALLYATSLPDLATHDAEASGRVRRLTPGWRGTAGQWTVLSVGLILLGALYFVDYVLVHLLVASDLALSLVPRWSSAAFPPYHAISGLQAGTAATVLALALVRRFEPVQRHIEPVVFAACGKVLLVLSLIWFWFVWSEFLTYWYGRTPDERWLLDLLMFGPSLVPFLLAFALSSLLPFLLLMWNRIRGSMAGTVAASALILVGILIDRIRVFGVAWALAGPPLPEGEPLPSLAGFPLPGLADVLVVAGMPALVLALFLLALRLVPPLPLWEVRAAALLTVRETSGETRVVVEARPSPEPDTTQDPVATARRINEDLLRFTRQTSRWYWVAVAVCALIVGAAGACLVLMIVYGLGLLGYTNNQMWTILITNFVFWVGISHAGVMISAVLRLTEAEWRRPISRAAEVLTVFALMAAALFPVIHTGRMWRTLYWALPYDFTRQIWPNIRSALIWDVSAIVSYLTGTLLFVYVTLIPDLAVARDRTGGWRGHVYRTLALGFHGTERQWRVLHLAGPLLAALILPVFVSVHSTVAWDFSMTLVPGWHSTIYAPYFIIGAVHSGVGAVVIMMAILRHVLGAEAYITSEHFDALGRLQIAVALGWLFFWLCDFFFGIFTREPMELAVWELRLLTWPYSAISIVFFLTVIVVPFPLLLFRRVRRSPLLMFAIGASINIGMWLERFLLIVPPLSWKQPFVFTWVTPYEPRLIEYILTIATFAFVTLGLLLFAKLFPIIPILDVEEGRLLRRTIRVGRTRVSAVVRE